MTLTEQQFLDHFVAGRGPERLKLQRIIADFETPEGVPDLLGAETDSATSLDPERLQLLSNGSGRVLSLLHNRSPRRATYLRAHTGLSADTVRRVLRDLVAADMVVTTDAGSYLLGPGASLPLVELAAFEFKLKDVRRAIRQASRYRTFSARAFIVMPPQAASAIGANRDRLVASGIGAIVYNPATGELTQLVSARKGPPLQRHVYLDVVGRFLLDDAGNSGARRLTRFPRTS